MKNLFILSMLFIGLIGNAQKKTLRATYDPSKNALILKDKGVCHNKSFSIKVDGINTSLHKIVVKYKDFNLVSERPKALEMLFPGIPNSSTISRFSLDGDNCVEMLAKAEVTWNNLNKIAKRLKELHDNKKLYPDYSKEDKKSKEKSTDLTQDVLIKKLKDIRNDILSSSSQGDVTDEEKEKILLKIKNGIEEILGFYDYLSKQNNCCDYAECMAAITSYYKEIKANGSSIYGGLKAVIDGANKPALSSIESDAHHPTKDITTVNIYIIDKLNPSDTLVEFEEDIYTTFNLELDFSTGLSYHKRNNDSYYFVRNDTAAIGIAKEDQDDKDISVTALLHANVRVLPVLSLGLGVGASTSIFDAKVRFLIGPSLTLGKKQTITLSYGFAYESAKYLSGQISTDGSTVSPDAVSRLNGLDAVPTYTKILRSNFFSITYNLTRKKEK